jgi:hypothetical protein
MSETPFLDEWRVGEGMRLLHRPQSRLHLTNNIMTIDSYEPMPSAWVRFWYWRLLRWWWEPLP